MARMISSPVTSEKWPPLSTLPVSLHCSMELRSFFHAEVKSVSPLSRVAGPATHTGQKRHGLTSRLRLQETRPTSEHLLPPCPAPCIQAQASLLENKRHSRNEPSELCCPNQPRNDSRCMRKPSSELKKQPAESNLNCQPQVVS